MQICAYTMFQTNVMAIFKNPNGFRVPMRLRNILFIATEREWITRYEKPERDLFLQQFQLS